MTDEADQARIQGAVIRSLPVVYFNATMAQATEYELSLDLGFRAGPTDPELAVRAVTSWEHAKRLRDLLDRLIAAYEDQAGPIREFPEEGIDPKGG